MTPLLLAPLLAKLAESGLNLIGNAVLNKGKQVVEEKLGVSLDDELATDEGRQALLQLQTEHEQFLITAAIENRKIDMADTANARAREVAIAATDSSWLAKNIVPLLAILVTVGGGFIVTFSPEADVRLGVISIIMLVLGYYFGTSKGNDRQTAAIQDLAAKQGDSK
jgi:hypothetical protein